MSPRLKLKVSIGLHSKCPLGVEILLEKNTYIHSRTSWERFLRENFSEYDEISDAPVEFPGIIFHSKAEFPNKRRDTHYSYAAFFRLADVQDLRAKLVNFRY